jgi:hypothetical protein
MRGLLPLVLLTACAASMVSSAKPSDSPDAPINERTRTGVVKYLNDGAGFVKSKRREDAYKKMHESCGGPYRIVAEGPKEEGGVVVATSSETAALLESHFWYIQYACVRPTPRRAQSSIRRNSASTGTSVVRAPRNRIIVGERMVFPTGVFRGREMVSEIELACVSAVED